jgi:hypothetical protein
MKEIFEKISAHYIEGMMVHDQMMRYYDFLNLRGYKRYHEYQFYCDTKMYGKINKYFINHHSELIPEIEIKDPGVIPDAWYRYKREEVDTQTKRNAIENGMTRWVEWERDTKEMLESSIKELRDGGHVSDAMFLEKCLCKVDAEYKHAMRKMVALKSINYDIEAIISEQTRIHDKYKHKIQGWCE